MLESNQRLAIIDHGLPPQHANIARAGDPGLLLPEAPLLVARDGFEPPRRLYESRVLPTELASRLSHKSGWPGRIRTCAWRD
jgi:hypothetical protein